MNSLIATVAVDNTFFSYDTDYSYIVPNSLRNDVQIGSKVSVPFGRGDKTRDGIIVNLIEELNDNIDGLKEIKSVGKKYSAMKWLNSLCGLKKDAFVQLMTV